MERHTEIKRRCEKEGAGGAGELGKKAGKCTAARATKSQRKGDDREGERRRDKEDRNT